MSEKSEKIWWKMPTKVIKNRCFGGPRGLLGGVWGALGAPGRALGAILAPKTQKSEQNVLRCPPPGPPSWSQNPPKIDMMGVLRASLLKKVQLWGVFVRALVLVMFFEGPNVEKVMILGGSNPYFLNTVLHFGRIFNFS